MNVPLIPYKKDPIWILFAEVIKVIDSISFQQELARNGMNDTNNIRIILKITPLSIFFKLMFFMSTMKLPSTQNSINF
jgi:hypothetical protein